MINKDTRIEEVLMGYSNGQLMLQGFGMHCFGCPISRMETLEEAAQVHGIDLKFMLAKLNEYLVEGSPEMAPKKVRAGGPSPSAKAPAKRTGKK
jgi:hybrid cluster-associated redox disulfide protein